MKKDKAKKIDKEAAEKLKAEKEKALKNQEIICKK